MFCYTSNNYSVHITLIAMINRKKNNASASEATALRRYTNMMMMMMMTIIIIIIIIMWTLSMLGLYGKRYTTNAVFTLWCRFVLHVPWTAALHLVPFRRTRLGVAWAGFSKWRQEARNVGNGLVNGCRTWKDNISVSYIVATVSSAISFVVSYRISFE